MNNASLYMPLIDASVTLVSVRFHERERGEIAGREYVYKTEARLSVGDVVVCETGAWYGVATVTQINLPMPMDDTGTVYRWIVQRVDTNDHTHRIEFERNLIGEINAMRAASVRERVLAEMGLTADAIKRVRTIAGSRVDDAEVIDDADEATEA